MYRHACIAICLLFFARLVASTEDQESRSDRRVLLGQTTHGTTAETILNSARHPSQPTPMHFQTWSTPHKPSAQAIFSCALSTSYMDKDAVFFAGTARRSGFTGDIVVAVLPDSNQGFLDKLQSYNVSVYVAPLKCARTGSGHSDVRCKMDFAPNIVGEYPITLARYFYYRQWAIIYPQDAYIMLADFRDVIFQSNPFQNRFGDWGPSHYDITIFQEAHPNRVINRCPHMGGFVLRCYGKEVFRKIGASVVASSGVVFGVRDAIVVYVSPPLPLSLSLSLSPCLSSRL
jgi:hypothetical protein